jgi:hypothetical protein
MPVRATAGNSNQCGACNRYPTKMTHDDPPERNAHSPSRYAVAVPPVCVKFHAPSRADGAASQDALGRAC